MGNVTFIIPTKKINQFNKLDIHTILSKEFPDLRFDSSNEFDEINVFKNETYLMDLMLNLDCYILDFKKDIKELDESNQKDLAKQLMELESLNPNLSEIMQVSYCFKYGVYKYKKRIENFLRKYFQTYTFDEGIHPEFMGPDYIPSNYGDNEIDSF